MHLRASRRVFVTTVAAAVLLPVTMAAAHPGLRPDELRPGETITSELIIPHGCGTEGGMPDDDAEASPTVELAMQWPEGIEIHPMEVDGWITVVDEDEAVATWLDDGGATTDALLLPVTISASVDAAGDILVAVFQGCENGESFRWVAAAGAEGDPGVGLTVAGEPVPAPTATVAPSEPAAATTPPAASPTVSEPAAPPPSAKTTPPGTPTATPPSIASATPVAAAADQDDGGINGLVVTGLTIVVAIAAALIWRRNRAAHESV